jgi:transcription initiation factor IIF auxiliary subunit
MLQLSTVNLNETESNSYFVEQSYNYIGDDYWDWSVWIESNDPKKLDKISSVTYHLHNTFHNPVRIINDRKSKFRLDTSGWGTFTIYIVINLKDKSVIELKHNLILEYPDTPLKDTKKNVKKK